jgi:hypothetical protein
MPAYTRLEPDAVMLIFQRDGEETETEVVTGGGERVLLFALAMLIRRRRLRDGDRLSVVRTAREGGK